MERFEKYITYIKNTGRVPLSVALFDDDFEPIGPTIRQELEAAGVIQIKDGGIFLVGNRND